VAEKYWVLGTGNISDTAHISDSDGGAGGASLPTSGDNLNFTVNSHTTSYTVTVDATANCADMTWANPASGSPTFTGGSDVNIYGSLTCVAGMGWTYSATITFKATSTGKTITTAGRAMRHLIFDGVGGGWTLQDTLTLLDGRDLVLFNGTLDTGNYNISGGSGFNFYIYAGTKTLNLGSSTIDYGSGVFNCSTPTGLTFNPGTSIIKGTGTFTGGGQTYNEVQLNGTAHTLTQSNTFATLTRTGTATKTDSLTLAADQTVTGTLNINGNSSSNRLMVKSDTLGTARTINCTGATTNFTDVDFQDITISGSPTTGTNVRVGDCGGNTGITFTAAADKFWVGNGGSWSDATNHWATSTGGSPGVANYPLPQDTAKINADSISSGSQTITMDEPRYGSIDFTGVLNSPTVSYSNDLAHFGAYTQSNGVTYTTNSKLDYYYGSAVNLSIAGANEFTTVLGRSFAFNTINIDASAAAKTLKITNSTTQTCANFTRDAGTNVVTITNTSGTTAGILAKSGGGTISLDYVALTYNTGSPANTWHCGANSTVGAGVTGWSKEFVQLAAEALGITESGVMAPMAWVLKVGAEAMGIADSIMQRAFSVRYVPNTVGIADSLMRRALSNRLIAETVGIADSAIKRAWSIRLFADDIGITDAENTRFALLKSCNEAIGVTEDAIRRSWLTKITAEGIGIADSFIKRAWSIRLTPDSIGLVDSFFKRAFSIRPESETVGVTDSGTRRAWSVRMLAENLGVSDSIIKRAYSNRLVSEAIGLTDSIIKRMWSVRPTAEQITLSDMSIRRAWAVRMAAEVIAITDSLVRRMISSRLIAETVGVIDSMLSLRWLMKISNEVIAITDSMRGILFQVLRTAVKKARMKVSRLPFTRIDKEGFL
jgi:hypothetical protein